MAWEFTYEILLTVASEKHSIDELTNILLPLESTSIVPLRKGTTHVVWRRRFCRILKPIDTYDGFSQEFAVKLEEAVCHLMPIKEKLLGLSSIALVHLIVRIFQSSHAVFFIDERLASSLSGLGLKVIFEFYGYDFPVDEASQ